MRNEEIVEIMKAMETNFKQHADDQLAKFLSLLAKHIASTEHCLTQLSQENREPRSLAKCTEEYPEVEAESSQVGGRRFISLTPQPDLNSLLKTLRVDASRFDGTNVENWIYMIDKFFGAA